MSLQHLLLFAVIGILLLACPQKGTYLKPPDTVPKVDLARYMGTLVRNCPLP